MREWSGSGRSLSRRDKITRTKLTASTQPYMESTEGGQLRDILSKRYQIVESLNEEARTKPALVDELEYSRSTINRAIDELVGVGCVEPTETAGRRFKLTSSGKIAFQLHREYRTDTDRLRTNSALLNAIPSDDPLDRAFLSGADVHSSAQTPDVAIRPGIELLKESDKMIGTAPVVQREYFRVLSEKLRSGRFELELVIDSNLHEAIKRNYGEEFDVLTDFEATEVYVTDTLPSYALWLTEGPYSVDVGITIYDEGGVKGTIVNDTDSAVSWTRDRYARYRESASRIRGDQASRL